MPKISALPVASAATGAELTAVVQGGVTKKLATSAYPISTATQTAIDQLTTTLTAAVVAAQADIDAHEANTSNPHSVTKAQVGLGNADNTSDATKNAAAVTLTNKTIALTSNTLTNQKTETGTVSAPLINQLNNTLFASDFGAVGDNATNDYAALQAWLNAVASSGKEGRLDPGKKYYVSGADLTFTGLVGTGSYGLYGMGSMLRTNPSESRIGLTVSRNYTGSTRRDESVITLVEGWTIDHYQDANAVWGMKFIGPNGNIIIRDCRFAAGGDGTGNQGNYGAIRFEQGTNTNPDTAIFWTEIENCRFKGGANQIPNGIWFVGGHNATSITKCNIANTDCGIRFEAANRLGAANANNAVISNGVKILDNSFEGILDGIKFNGISTVSRCLGLQVCHNRIESILVGGSAFFNYGLDTFSETPPILGPNYLSSGDWGKYIYNPNALAIDVRDEYVGRTAIDPASLAAGATTTIGTITLAPSATGDQVRIETMADLQGLIATGYVSAANTVTIRLTNPRTAAVDLGSTNFVARVRPQY